MLLKKEAFHHKALHCTHYRTLYQHLRYQMQNEASSWITNFSKMEIVWNGYSIKWRPIVNKEH